jgi:hypothetical protein
MVEGLVSMEKFPPVKNKMITIDFYAQRFHRTFDEIITNFDAALAALL